MGLVQITPEDAVFMAPIGPARFDTDNWGKVNRFEQVLPGAAIGHGITFEHSRVFRSFEMVFAEGACWQETPFFQDAVRLIGKGRTPWGCRTPEALIQRLEADIGALYRSIKTHGVLSQKEISELVRADGVEGTDAAASRNLILPFARTGYPSSISHKHEIKLGVNEAGDFLFLDGRHRFAIARLLKSDGVPCRIVFRHHAWDRLRNRLAAAASEPETGCAVLVSRHPDLAHLRLSARQAEAAQALQADGGWPRPDLHLVPNVRADDAAGSQKR